MALSLSTELTAARDRVRDAVVACGVEAEALSAAEWHYNCKSSKHSYPSISARVAPGIRTFLGAAHYNTAEFTFEILVLLKQGESSLEKMNRALLEEGIQLGITQMVFLDLVGCLTSEMLSRCRGDEFTITHGTDEDECKTALWAIYVQSKAQLKTDYLTC